MFKNDTNCLSLVRRITIFFAVVIFIVFARSFYTEQPEIHDARKKWVVASEIAESGDLTKLVTVDHHSSRWGLILPTSLAINLFGKNLITYLGTLLVLYGVIFAMLLVLAARDISRGLLLVFGVLLFYEPMFFRASTQLQPFIFGVFYITVSLWLLTRFIDYRNHWILLLSAFMAFLAYATKLPYIFFVPGLLILLWIRVDIRNGCYYSLYLLAFLFLETVAFNTLDPELIMGRVEFLMSGKHVAKMTGNIEIASASRNLVEYYNSLTYPDKLVEFIFGKWKRLPIFNQLLSVVSLSFSVLVIAKRRLHNFSNFSVGVILITLSFSVLISVVPLSIRPLVPLQPLWGKYLTPVMPFCVFIFILCFDRIIKSINPTGQKRITVIANSIVLLFGLYAIYYESPFTYQHRGQIYPAKGKMIWKYQELNRALVSGAGICAKNFRQLNKIKVLLNQYMNKDHIRDKLTFSRDGDLHILHLKTYDVDEIKTFILSKNYDSRLTRSQCIDYFYKG